MAECTVPWALAGVATLLFVLALAVLVGGYFLLKRKHQLKVDLVRAAGQARIEALRRSSPFRSKQRSARLRSRQSGSISPYGMLPRSNSQPSGMYQFPNSTGNRYDTISKLAARKRTSASQRSGSPA